jgi:hypothetical protein
MRKKTRKSSKTTCVVVWASSRFSLMSPPGSPSRPADSAIAWPGRSCWNTPWTVTRSPPLLIDITTRSTNGFTLGGEPASLAPHFILHHYGQKVPGKRGRVRRHAQRGNQRRRQRHHDGRYRRLYVGRSGGQTGAWFAIRPTQSMKEIGGGRWTGNERRVTTGVSTTSGRIERVRSTAIRLRGSSGVEQSELGCCASVR